MADFESSSADPVGPLRPSAVRPGGGTDPSEVRNLTDPGDATSRNFRYQHAYGVVLLVAAKRGLRPYVAIWCEHHEDFLAQRDDGLFDGYQIKTARPEVLGR
jgi:Cap4 dsDNA endonuclease